MKDRSGYRGQKYEVFFMRDGEEHRFGWQNTSTGGLEKAVKLMPGVTSVRVAAVPQAERNAYWRSLRNEEIRRSSDEP